MSDFFSFSLKILLPDLLSSFCRLRIYASPQNWQSYYLLQEHIPFGIDLDLKIMNYFLLCWKFLRSIWLIFLNWVFFRLLLVFLKRHFYFFCDEKISLLLRLACLRDQCRNWLGLCILVGDFIVDDFYRSLEDKSKLQNSRVMVMNLI